jgi:hypothetical protein
VHTATGSVPDHARLAVDARGRGIVVWEDSTAVRRRIFVTLHRGGWPEPRPRPHVSQAIKAWAPDVAVGPGRVLVAWHEEQFPATKTIVVHVTAEEKDR